MTKPPQRHRALGRARALAFVRQCHGLTNGDLDRTHRQQAFLASAAHNIRSPATLLNPVEMQSLINATKNDVVIDDGWTVWSVAVQLCQLTSGAMEFQTLLIIGDGTLNGQDVNLIDPDRIRALIHNSFTDHPSSPPLPASTIDVVNSSAETAPPVRLPLPCTSTGSPPARVSTGALGHTSTVAYSTDTSTDAHTVA